VIESPVTGGETATLVDRPGARERSAAAPIARRVGHFQLLELLGEGGMGEVYSAYDLDLDRKVAIKVLAKHPASAEDTRDRQQRLLREAQAMAKLSHPNVVPVYEVGVDGDSVFIAMEYVEGRTLHAWLRDTPRTWREVVDVFVQAGRGLAAAHEADIVHRDFKPANVLIADRGRVLVADFGIARITGTIDPDESQPVPKNLELPDGGEITNPTPATPLTEQGSLVGTPAYMSPEQHRGDAADSRSDQFSFCVTLHEALFEKRPFAGRGKVLADNVLRGVVAKPDPAAKVPGWVTAILLRGLTPNPDDRFPSMTALCDALEHDPGRLRRRVGAGVLGAIAIATVAAIVGSRLSRPDETCAETDTHFAGVWDDSIAAAIASNFTAAAVPYSTTSFARVRELLDRYRERWLAMREDACRATRRREQSEHVLELKMACLDRRLGEVRALTAVLASRPDARLVEHAVEGASSLSPLDSCADTSALLDPHTQPTDPMARARRAELQDRLDQLTAAHRVSRVEDTLEPARALVESARAAQDLLLFTEALELRGNLEMQAGQLAASEATLAEALRLAHRLGDTDLFVAIGTDLVSTLAENGISRAREALGMIRLVESFVGDTHDPKLPFRLRMEKADENMVLAHPEIAIPILESTIAEARHQLGDDHVMVLRLRSLYGSALDHAGNDTRAIAAHDALLATSVKVLGELHPSTLIIRLQRCRAVVNSGAGDAGIRCFATTLPDALRVLGGSHRELLSFRAFYGLTLYEHGQLEEARRVYTAAFTDVPAEAWKDQWFVAGDIGRMLGSIEVDLADYRSALAHCTKAVVATEQEHAGPVGATCIGEAELALGNAEHALEVLEPVRATVDGVDPKRLQISRGQLGAWRFAYARAVWAIRHRAAEARALGEAARDELAGSRRRAQLDAWLATVR